MLFYLIAAAILAADQLIKIAIHASMRLNQSFPLIDDWVRLTYVRNTGAAFSLFMGFSLYLMIIGIAVVFALVYFHAKTPSRFSQIALALILGGSLGNLADRIFRGYVVDYIDIGWWPVFNLADIMINLGAALVAFRLWQKRKDHAPNLI